MRDYILSLGGMLVLLLFTGCHFFDDPDDLDECPLNWGYPCACTYDDEKVSLTGECRDGSGCLYFDNESRGICANQCDGTSDVGSCEETWGYGEEGLCWFQANGSDTPNFCAVFCQGNGRGNCSPGMECSLIAEDSDYRVCLPKP